MLRHLDEEMRKRNVQAIVVLGDTTLANPDLAYVAGHLPRGGIYFKQMDEDPLLVVSNIDLGNAKKSRKVRRITTYTEWGYEKLITKYGRANAQSQLLARIVNKERVKGRITIYGRNDLATGVHLQNQLKKLGVNTTGEPAPTILEIARETKNSEELQRIRAVGKKTGEVVESVLETLRNAKRKRGRLYLGKKRATVGRVKKLIAFNLAAADLVAPEGTIFATGASSADPHNSGIVTDEIREGQLIVFDIFPQAEDGYWFDLTRTFVLRRADAKAKRLFDTVCDAQTASLDYLRAGITGEDAMSKACDIIETHGYRTIRDVFRGKAKSMSAGFIHSLGHGVGLTIGERPNLAFLVKDPLKAGQVVTVEPGVYLPNYGGVRIEDTVAITSKGIDNLARVQKEFELS